MRIATFNLQNLRLRDATGAMHLDGARDMDKAPYPDAAAAWPVRRREALAGRRLIERRFQTPDRALWMILVDLNEPAEHPVGQVRAVAPLIGGLAVDLLERLPLDERWSAG